MNDVIHNLETIEKWLDENARFMASDRSDIYTFDTARADLSAVYRSMVTEENSTFVSFASYVLVRFTDEGYDEYILSRKLSSLTLFDDPGESYNVSHHADIDLPSLDDEVLT